ncbi:MAG: hypothetical protein RSB86_19070 [Comamonas sp.]|uniref:hypothetical protein n=1 Tax=Comamonas sp. TaxID=34028 RepID=UPI002FCA2333
MNVYLYAFLDLEGWVHSGLTTNQGRADVMQEIVANFGKVAHVMIRQAPELRPIWDDSGTHITGYKRVEGKA